MVCSPWFCPRLLFSRRKQRSSFDAPSYFNNQLAVVPSEAREAGQDEDEVATCSSSSTFSSLSPCSSQPSNVTPVIVPSLRNWLVDDVATCDIATSGSSGCFQSTCCPSTHLHACLHTAPMDSAHDHRAPDHSTSDHSRQHPCSTGGPETPDPPIQRTARFDSSTTKQLCFTTGDTHDTQTLVPPSTDAVTRAPVDELQQENKALRQLLLDHKHALYTAQRAQAELWLSNRQLVGVVTWLQRESAVRGMLQDALFEEVLAMRQEDSHELHAALQALCTPAKVLVPSGPA